MIELGTKNRSIDVIRVRNAMWTNLLWIAAFSFFISFIFLSGYEDNPVAVPASLAFTLLGMLSGATAAAVRAIGKRLEILEQASFAAQMLPAIPAEPGAAGKPPGSPLPADDSQ